jgi:Fe-S-cluster containining protein
MQCQRCGTCCEKGGPALHREDRYLVESGQIPARCLFTIRRGELARDNVQGTLVPMAGEVIKIRGQGGRWTCLFYDRERRGCGIYDHRPLECRALNCRDTRQIEAVYAAERLTRADLLVQMEGMWELIVDHDTRCGYDHLRDLVSQGAQAGQLKTEAAILEILRYDAHLRQLTVETGGLDAGMLDFIFGRPLAETISMFDLRLVKEKERYRLMPTPAFSPRS